MLTNKIWKKYNKFMINYTNWITLWQKLVYIILFYTYICQTVHILQIMTLGIWKKSCQCYSIERALLKHNTIFLSCESRTQMPLDSCEIHGSVEIQIVNIIVIIGPLMNFLHFQMRHAHICIHVYIKFYI